MISLRDTRSIEKRLLETPTMNQDDVDCVLMLPKTPSESSFRQSSNDPCGLDAFLL